MTVVTVMTFAPTDPADLAVGEDVAGVFVALSIEAVVAVEAESFEDVRVEPRGATPAAWGAVTSAHTALRIAVPLRPAWFKVATFTPLQSFWVAEVFVA